MIIDSRRLRVLCRGRAHRRTGCGKK